MAMNKSDKIKIFLIKFLLKFSGKRNFSTLQKIGSFIGRVANLFPNDLKRVAKINIGLCFPNKTPKEKAYLVKESLKETCKNFFEMAAFWTHPVEHLAFCVKNVFGEEHIEQAINNKKAVLVIAPHLGSWELVNFYMASRFPTTVLYRPPKLAELDPIIKDARQRTGSRLVPTTKDGIKAVLAALKNNEAVGILPDQVPPPNAGEFAPFFGIDAYTMTLIPKLAQKTNAQLFYGFAVRRDIGPGFDLYLIPADPKIADKNLKTALTAMNKGIEECVLKFPTQYQWSYKRFKNRPENCPDLYAKKR